MEKLCMNIGFDYPIFFLLLLLIPCFFRCKRENLKIYFSKTDLLPKFWLPKKDFLIVSIFILLVISLTSPFLYSSIQTNQKKGRDLILAIDASGSMGFDMDGKSKFQRVLELSKDFLKKRFDDNIGIVVFGSFAYIASPVTYDLKALNFILDYLDTSVAGNSTAIGEAIYQSIKALEKSNAKNKVIVLLTDGYHNSGQISPKEAIKLAKKKNIKIYTIGIGDEFDKKLLQKIASNTKGKTFAAKNSEDLKNIFDELNRLEKSPIRSGNYINKQQLFIITLSIALILIFFYIFKNRRLA